LAIDPELVHAGSEEDEGTEVPLLPRSHRTKGPAVVMTEALLGEVTERQTTRGDSSSAPVPTKVVPSSSFQSQGMIIDPTDIQPVSSVEMMSSVEDPEESPTVGLVEFELPTTGVLPTPISSSSSSEKLDYSGDDDVDWDTVHPSPDTSKYSHLAEEEMQVAALKTELPFGETFTSEGILFYPSLCLFFVF